MNFTSLLFLPLYAVTALLYQRLESRARVLLLLAASWTFFLLESPGSGVILFFVTLVTYAAGLLLARSSGKMKTRRLILTLVLVITLGLLGVFKYSGRFFLPVGISFYTFQALSYVIDVYRGDFPAERRFSRYALYLSFFPQVVAGPIERPKDLMGQLACERPAGAGDFRVGGFLMLRGYAKKIMIADAIAPVSDALFADSALTGPKVLAAAAYPIVWLAGTISGRGNSLSWANLQSAFGQSHYSATKIAAQLNFRFIPIGDSIAFIAKQMG